MTIDLNNLNNEEMEKAQKESCDYCALHCGEIYHFNLAKLNFELEKKIKKLENEINELKQNKRTRTKQNENNES